MPVSSRPPRPLGVLAVVVGLLVASGCASQRSAPPAAAAASAPRVSAVFLDAERGKAVIGQRDEFTAAMSRFDLQSRTGSQEAVTLDAYLAALPAHVRAFTAAEQARISAAMNAVLERMAAAGLEAPASPAVAQFVRTDGAEELGAVAYTRGATIFVGDQFFTLEDAMVRHVVAHELFHLWSRANPDTIRWPTHEALGFVRVPGARLPASLVDRKLTNPDDPVVEETIEVTIAGAKVTALLGLIASSDYRGGSPLDYLKAPQLVDVATGALHPLESAQGFFEKIGTSTKYILSAEEIAAEYFATGVLTDQPINDPTLIAAVLRPFAR
jgi:hypothetical protein